MKAAIVHEIGAVPEVDDVADPSGDAIEVLAAPINPIEVARQAGHSPTMTLDTYSHVFEEATGAEHSSAEEAIRAARVPATYPPGEERVVFSNENPALAGLS